MIKYENDSMEMSVEEWKRRRACPSSNVDYNGFKVWFRIPLFEYFLMRSEETRLFVIGRKHFESPGIYRYHAI